MIKLKKLLTEKTVRLSTMKDANFEPGQFVQLMGKKGMVKLDKKSVHKLAKIVRQLSGKKGMGWSFTMERKLPEGGPGSGPSKAYKTASRNELAMYISQLSTTIKNTKDRKMLNYLKKDKKEVEKELKSRKTNEGKLNEGSKVVTLPNGIKVKIEFDGLTFIGGTKPVFLDRNEMMTFFKATARYLK